MSIVIENGVTRCVPAPSVVTRLPATV